MLRPTQLSPRDRAFVTDLVYDTLRRQRRLDDLVARVVDRPVARLDAPVRAALRLGAKQLLDGIPAHAAVGETVGALGRRSPRAQGYANAVLRTLDTLGPPWPEPQDAAAALSYPDWIVERLTADLGAADAHDALVAMNEPAVVTLRPNPRRTTASELARDLRRLRVRVARGALVRDALTAVGLGDPARLDAVRKGLATPQDQASQAVVALLDPQPGERILDLAAAPGGKTTAIAERALGAVVVAVDADRGRLGLVRRAQRRLRLPEIRAVAADGRDLPFRADTFDRVLVDAPCSGLGVLRRRAEARWRITPDDIDALADVQRALLRAAAVAVKPGGVVVYSVCTLSRAETHDIDSWAAAELPQLVEDERPPEPWRPLGRGALLLPQTAGTDGMFAVRLRRER